MKERNIQERKNMHELEIEWKKNPKKLNDIKYEMKKQSFTEKKRDE